MTQSLHTFHTALESLFLLIKKYPEMKSIEIFDYCFFFTAYADMQYFF